MVVLKEESRSRDHLIEGSDQAVSSQYCFSLGASSAVERGLGSLLFALTGNHSSLLVCGWDLTSKAKIAMVHLF